MKGLRFLLPALAAVLATVGLGALMRATPPAAAVTFTVTTTADTNDGTCDADCSLREAIVAANAAAGAVTIDLPAGTYTLTIAGSGEDAAATGDLDVTDDLTVSGAGAAATIIDGNDLDRVFHVVGGTVGISGVTIQNGLESIVGGGGIFNAAAGILTVTSTTVADNTTLNANRPGGGIYSVGTLTVNSSTISGNSSSAWGGGITNNATLVLNNSTISGNTAVQNGGAIDQGAGTMTVNNSTISSNTGSSTGGIKITSGSGTIKNTIVASNSFSQCLVFTTITSAGHNLSGDSSCSFTATGDLQNTNPLLGPLADNGGPTQTHALLAGSPAIDAGSPDCPPPAADQRGVARPQGTACDIGAYERAGVNTTADELNADGDCSLREAITAANTDAPVDACPAGSGADTIELPAGTHSLTITGSGEDAAATGDLDITADLTINGAGAATTIIDGGDLDRVFHILGGTPVQISGVTIQNGSVTALGGGGIINLGTLTLTDSAVSGNTATGVYGGGIINLGGGTLTITGSTVSGNTVSDHGGGIYNGGGTAILTNSTVSGNSGGRGGGISNYSTLTMTNVTVSGNTASITGGGIWNDGSGATLKNTIVANSPAGGDCYSLGAITSAGHNLSGDSTCGFTASGDLQNTNPLLGPLADNGGPTQTHALLGGSPAIDAGSLDCPPPAADQRGVARPQAPTCDIGAFEADDSDGDTVVDVHDNCPADANPGQEDNDADALGDACDPDDDNDGVPDTSDNCQLAGNPAQLDLDGDGLGNACDPDIDNDGIDNASDPDDDNDEKPDSTDSCLYQPEDYDGFQDADGCPDTDNDLDGITDVSDSGKMCFDPANTLSCPTQDCRSVAEDIDGFHDSDGCPEPDNDNDSFPDSTDQCPGTDSIAGADAMLGSPQDLNHNGVRDDPPESPLTTDDSPLALSFEDFDDVIDTDGCHDSPGGDFDGDGFTDDREALHLGTNPTNGCSLTTTANDEDPDPWPPDADDDQDIDVGDLIKLFYGKILNPPAYSARSDFDGDTDIDVADIIIGFYGRIFTSCV